MKNKMMKEDNPKHVVETESMYLQMRKELKNNSHKSSIKSCKILVIDSRCC